MQAVRIVVTTLAATAASAAVIAACEAAAHQSLTGDARFAAATLGYGLGALAASAIASGAGVKRVGTGVVLLLGVLALINLLSFPHPWWFAPLAAVALTLGWLGGRWLGKQARAHRTHAS